MKLAIMQPYFLPYLGYFQLISAVDRFVFYDDVSFIKGGWINRNRILVQGKTSWITVPVSNGSSNVTIRDVMISDKWEYWTRKTLRTIAESYSKAPFFESAYGMFESWLSTNYRGIAELNLTICQDICSYLNIDTVIVSSSTIYGNSELSSVNRVLDICRRENASSYVNASGGRELYIRDAFREEGIQLQFLSAELPQYDQGKGGFVPGLSILDLLMHNSADSLYTMVQMGRVVD